VRNKTFVWRQKKKKNTLSFPSSNVRTPQSVFLAQQRMYYSDSDDEREVKPEQEKRELEKEFFKDPLDKSGNHDFAHLGDRPPTSSPARPKEMTPKETDTSGRAGAAKRAAQLQEKRKAKGSG
jgi:hypothetical protein